MASLYSLLYSSFSQLGVVLVISLLVFGIVRVVHKKAKTSFIDFLGLRNPAGQLDRTFLLILFAMILFAIANVLAQFYLSPTMKGFMVADTSPYGKILRGGFGPVQIVAGFVYSFVQSGASEEVLFRGLIARRLFNRFGFAAGNTIQALIFWLMHLLIFRLVTGEWLSLIQLYTFLVSFGLGLVLGFVNYRKGGASIAPSWIIHSMANFATFLTLGILLH